MYSLILRLFPRVFGSRRQLIENLTGPLHHRGGNAGEASGFDAVAAAGAAGLHAMQKQQVIAGFLHQHLEVGHIRALCRQVVELVIVRREHGAGLQVAGQVFAHGPGDGEAIKGGSATADLIEQHQGAIGGVMEDVGGFRHFHHEGGLAGTQLPIWASSWIRPIWRR